MGAPGHQSATTKVCLGIVAACDAGPTLDAAPGRGRAWVSASGSRHVPRAKRGRNDLRGDEADAGNAVEDMGRRHGPLNKASPSHNRGWKSCAAARIMEWDAQERQERVYGRIIPSEPGMRHSVLRQPIGVGVAAFSPWNFPMSSPGPQKSAGGLVGGLLDHPESVGGRGNARRSGYNWWQAFP